MPWGAAPNSLEQAEIGLVASVDTRKSITVATLVLLAMILVTQLLVPPIVGRADQGDFGRLWQWFGIESTIAERELRYFAYVIREWQIDPSKASSSGFVAADLLLVAAAVQLDRLVGGSDGLFDIRYLAAVRIAVFLFAAFLLLRAASLGGVVIQVVTALALVLVAADVGYISYFNSGFSEPGSLIFCLLTIAFYVRLGVGQGHRGINLTAFVACGILLLWSKPQNVVLALPLAVLAMRLATLDPGKQWRAATFAVAGIVIAGALLYRALPPPEWYQQSIRHIAVFNSLLVPSADPASDLRALGVNPRLAVLKGRFPWEAEAQQFANELQTDFHGRIDQRDIAAFYLRNPSRLLDVLKLAASQSLAVQGANGQFEAASGRPPFTRATAFAMRSDFVRAFGPHRFRWLVALLGAAIVVAGFAWAASRTSSARLMAEGVLALAAAAILQYVVVAVLQGPVAVAKGMVLFAFLYDATLVAGVLLVVHRGRLEAGAFDAGPTDGPAWRRKTAGLERTTSVRRSG